MSKNVTESYDSDNILYYSKKTILTYFLCVEGLVPSGKKEILC